VKLESTITDRSGMIYTAPLVDVVLLLIIFFLFGTSLVLKSGVGVSLPRSSSALPMAEDAHIITLLPGSGSTFFFNDRKSDLASLDGLLEGAAQRSRQVVLLGDESVSYGMVMEVSRVVLEKGFDLSFATQESLP